MKRVKAFALALVMLLSLCATALPQNVFATEVASGTCGDNLTWVLDDEGTLTISGTGAMTNYAYSNAPWYSNRSSIKAVVIEVGVTSIGDYAFYWCTSLTSVTIPDSVTSIGVYAFEDCTSLEYNVYDNAKYLGNSENPYHVLITCTSKDLTSCEIHEDTRVIYRSAFCDCTSLESVTIPDSVTSIGEWAFSRCTSLESITIPDSVTSIGEYAFKDCTSLESITIPDSVTSIGYDAFSGCTSLEYNVYDNAKYLGNSENPYLALITYTSQDLTSCEIHEDAKVIADAAFCWCYRLTSVTIGDSVTSIGDYPFRSCTSLTGIWVDENNAYYSSDDYGVLFNKDQTTLIQAPGVISGSYVIPDSVTSIGSSAFEDCASLTSVTIPDSVTSIGNRAFYGCTGLESVTIGNGVTSIGNRAFYGCTGLESVTIGNGVTSIGDSAFDYCTSLNAVYITDVAAWCGIAFGGSYSNPLYFAGNLYLNGELVTDLVIPDGVTSIGGCAFSSCYNLTSVTIPDSVISIGDAAFEHCTRLNAVYITDIAAWCGIAFGSYEGNPLYRARNLYLNGELVTGLVIPDSVTSIGDYAFYNCDSLESITIPDSVTSIGDEAFYGCTSLTSVTIGDSITSIGGSAFRDCTSLESITIPDSVTSIGWGAFRYCTSLESITIPDGVTSIGDLAFYNCTSLTGIWVDENNAYYSSDDYGVLFNKDKTELIAAPGAILGSYVIPDSVTGIGNFAFSDCTSLTSVTIGNSVTSIDVWAFNNCTGLTEIYFEGDAPSFGNNYVFYNVTATAYYPENNGTWTDSVRKNYGGSITWVTYEVHEHNYTESERTEATCTEDGYIIWVCECGDTYTEILPATGHSYVDGSCEHCGAADPDAILVGDANGDGVINHLDAMLIAQYYVGAISEDAIVLSASDVNGDGVINHLDAMMVAQFYVGAIDQLG